MPSPLPISVIIATFGDKPFWDAQAERALASVERQSRPADEIIRTHEKDLRTARNRGVELSSHPWCLFVDADDEIDPYYLAQMEIAQGDIRVPRLKYIYPDRCEWGQGICIGAMFRRTFFEQVGGFQDEPILEDLSLWTRMARAGARVGQSNAIYLAHVRENGRNSNQKLKDEWVTRILG